VINYIKNSNIFNNKIIIRYIRLELSIDAVLRSIMRRKMIDFPHVNSNILLALSIKPSDNLASLLTKRKSVAGSELLT